MQGGSGQPDLKLSWLLFFSFYFCLTSPFQTSKYRSWFLFYLISLSFLALFVDSFTRTQAVNDISFAPTSPWNFILEIQLLLHIFSWKSKWYLKFNIPQTNPPLLQRVTLILSAVFPNSVGSFVIHDVFKAKFSRQPHSFVSLHSRYQQILSVLSSKYISIVQPLLSISTAITLIQVTFISSQDYYKSKSLLIGSLAYPLNPPSLFSKKQPE